MKNQQVTLGFDGFYGSLQVLISVFVVLDRHRPRGKVPKKNLAPTKRLIMRGRKPTPPYLRLLGNPSKRPVRSEPQPKPPADVPEPPEFLLPLAADAWRTLAPELSRLKLLTALDRNMFAFIAWRFRGG
jgi:phage terminase small subunit